MTVIAIRRPPEPGGAALEHLELSERDQLIVTGPASGGCALAAANDAAEGAGNAWILFLGPGTDPEPGLLNEYFREKVDASCDMLVGALRGAPSGGPGFNLMIRTRAHASIGGFHENVRRGADDDLAMRLAQVGRRVEHRQRAKAIDTAGRTLREAFAAGAADRWLQRRSRATQQPRSNRLVPGGLLARVAFGAGSFAGSNVRRPDDETLASAPGRRLSLWSDAYPARSETFIYNEVEALTALGWDVRVQSLSRPARCERAIARRDRISYVEDDPPLSGLMSMPALALRHPWRCLADRRDSARWAREEPVIALRALAPSVARLARFRPRHIHVHFLFGAALSVMRTTRIRGGHYSVIGHGLDVFGRPANIAEKLESAALPLAPCAYTATFMRRLAPDAREPEVVVMGVDAELYRRSDPYPGGHRVIAIGRLVEKKGFRHLIDAAASLAAADELDRLTIVGDGPLRTELQARIDELGIGDRAEIVDAWGGSEIRSQLERAAILAMPAVVASDGDRDAMPVVVKEAMSMELPIVASDEVGLPELVEPAWGRLVEPGNPVALASALRELLAMPAGERAAMGALGRQHAIEHCSIKTEAERLTKLIEARGRD